MRHTGRLRGAGESGTNRSTGEKEGTVPANASTGTARGGRAAAREGDGPAVRELMTPRAELAVVAPETTLREVAALLAARHVAGAPVLAGSSVVGVVSAADLLDFAATADGGDDEAADDDEGWDAFDAAAAWDGEGEWAAEDEAGLGREKAAGAPEAGALDEHTAAEVMSRRLASVPPGASLRQAAQAMRAAGVHRLLVMDDGELVGMITSTDVVRAVADGLLAGRR
jgi:CBS domain-containing protein